MSRKPYVRPVAGSTWWLRQRRYIHYMAREVSSILIGIYLMGLIVGLTRLSQGPEAWEGYVDSLSSPVALVFHLIAFAFTTYHATSWFNVTPKAMRIPRGDDFVPGRIIIATHYAIWGVASLIILVIAGVL